MSPLKFFTDRYYRNAEMVSYWKTKDSVEAKLYRTKGGYMEMQMEGEKYAFQGYPRGTLLFGLLSPLKHEIKNQVFNDSWRRLEEGEHDRSILQNLNENVWPRVFEIGEKTRYDMVPFEKLNPPVKELWRAMTVAGVHQSLKEIIVFILQEDDAYRMRLQWLVKFFPRWTKPTIKDFEKALKMEEEAEMVSDMKERQRLFRRVFLLMVKDSDVFQKFLKVTDWKKVGLTKADKYFFRAKYFKVDYPEYQY